MEGTFLETTEAHKGRWRDDRDTSLDKKGISPRYYWTGKGRDALEVAYATASSKPGVSTVREVWKRRHGRAAAPLLLVVAYPEEGTRRATVCGPAGEDPRVVPLDYDRAERIAGAALEEANRHLASRFLASALEGDPEEQPGLRNKGLLATNELLYGVPERADWGEATRRSRPLLGSITDGTWLDPYTGQTLTDSSKIDIDHVVPLANAWRSGANSAEWSTVDREVYANDPEALLSTDAGTNRTKGDKGPEAWKPPNHDYWCEYARRWIWIKSDWHLTVNPAEKSSRQQMLGTCGAA